MANYFQYKVDVFFKGNMLDGLLVKTKRYGILIELQGVILKHMQLYGFLMSQTFKMELPTLSLLRKSLFARSLPSSCSLYNMLENQHFQLLFCMVYILMRRKLLQTHLDRNLVMIKTKRLNTLLKQVKSSIDNNLNPAKVNVRDSTK